MKIESEDILKHALLTAYDNYIDQFGWLFVSNVAYERRQSADTILSMLESFIFKSIAANMSYTQRFERLNPYCLSPINKQ